jgi:hypothetical protein
MKNFNIPYKKSCFLLLGVLVFLTLNTKAIPSIGEKNQVSFNTELNDNITEDSCINEVALPDNNALIVNESEGCIYIPECQDDFKAIVVSEDAATTTATFIPLYAGVGDVFDTLYYRINGGGNNKFKVEPYETFTLPGLTNGDSLLLFYKYSNINGVDVLSVYCKYSFVVGECGVIANENPTADAGADIEVNDTGSDGFETVQLNGMNSSDPEGSSLSFRWSNDTALIALGETSDLTLPVGTHKITLEVYDDLGGKGSDEVVVSVLEGTNIFNTKLSSGLKIYPSPVETLLNIESSKGNIESVQLFNALGMRVFDKMHVSQINLSQLSSGIYTVHVKVDGETLVSKVIKR